jgi:hypothetical protein
MRLNPPASNEELTELYVKTSEENKALKAALDQRIIEAELGAVIDKETGNRLQAGARSQLIKLESENVRLARDPTTGKIVASGPGGLSLNELIRGKLSTEYSHFLRASSGGPGLPPAGPQGEPRTLSDAIIATMTAQRPITESRDGRTDMGVSLGLRRKS